MSAARRSAMRILPTGVPGLDEVLGGGLPEYSFNLIAGPPGAGKTTLAHQVVFANASPERPALYFTVLGEPPGKMLRYQQQMGFFDRRKVGEAVRFVNLAEVVVQGGLERVLEAMVGHVQDVNPAWVVVDSFRTVARGMESAHGRPELDFQVFVQRLGLYLTSWQVTSLLVGEYLEDKLENNPIFTVADGIVWLSEHAMLSSTARQLRVAKMRGLPRMAGLHTFRITDAGLQVFPRRLRGTPEPAGRARPAERLSTGVAGLDEMLGGGLPFGDLAMVAGPSGSGKSVLGQHFLAEGLRKGEGGVVVLFEEHTSDYLAQCARLGIDLGAFVQAGKLEIIDERPLDLSVDEMLVWVKEAVARVGARRVVVDSLTGFEQALAAQWRGDNLLESLYRLFGALTDLGVTALLLVEPNALYESVSVSPHGSAFVVDTLILQRFAQLDGELAPIMAVAKMRHSAHSRAVWRYQVTGRGLVVAGPLDGGGGDGKGGPTRSVTAERKRPAPKKPRRR